MKKFSSFIFFNLKSQFVRMYFVIDAKYESGAVSFHSCHKENGFWNDILILILHCKPSIKIKKTIQKLERLENVDKKSYCASLLKSNLLCSFCNSTKKYFTYIKYGVEHRFVGPKFFLILYF